MKQHIQTAKKHAGTPVGKIVVVLLLLAASYGFGSLAIDNGSVFAYAACFGALYIALRVVYRMIRR